DGWVWAAWRGSGGGLVTGNMACAAMTLARPGGRAPPAGVVNVSPNPEIRPSRNTYGSPRATLRRDGALRGTYARPGPGVREEPAPTPPVPTARASASPIDACGW